MTTLAEIQAAAETLTPEEKRQLFRYLVLRLGPSSSDVPMPRRFSTDEVRSWIDEDEADYRRLTGNRDETVP